MANNLLTDIIGSGRADDLLRQFMAAAAFRSRFAWLGESESVPGEPAGLSYGLRYALVTYVPTYVSVDDPRNVSCPEPDVASSDWRADLLTVAEKVGSDPTCIDQFGAAVGLAGVRLDSGSEEVDHHVLRALLAYCERRWSGTASPDPW